MTSDSGASVPPPNKPLTMTIKVDADDFDGLMRALGAIEAVLYERPDSPAPRDYTSGGGWHLHVQANEDGLTGEAYFQALTAWLDARRAEDRSAAKGHPAP